MIFNNNDLILFFSLPFYPVIGKKNFFFNGHIAFVIDGKVYQIFNPNLLKTDFLVSIMPINEWLYNDSNYIVDKNKQSSSYSYVHLYKTSELKRTTVFYVILKKADDLIDKAKKYFNSINNKFQKKELKFDIYNKNCSTLIAEFFYQENLLKKSLVDKIPFLFFKRVVITFKKNNLNFSTGALFKIENKYFKIRKLCLGLFSFNAEKSILKWLKKYNYKKI